MFVRRRPLLRAAAVGGGAYMAGKARQRHQNERQEMAASQSAPAPETAGSAAGQPAGGLVSDQLSKLAALHDQGALTDSEFAAAKSRLLAQ